MTEPLFWLGLSILLVAVSLAAVLIAALPAIQELARAARSAEKLFDTLSRELPPTLESIRLTGTEITNLTEDLNQNVQSAGRVVEQLDQGLGGMKQQVRQAQVTSRSLAAGIKAAWQVLRQPNPPRSRDLPESDRRTHEASAPPRHRFGPTDEENFLEQELRPHYPDSDLPSRAQLPKLNSPQPVEAWEQRKPGERRSYRDV